MSERVIAATAKGGVRIEVRLVRDLTPETVETLRSFMSWVETVWETDEPSLDKPDEPT